MTLTEYLEKAVILDIIFGEPIQTHFMSKDVFPFEPPKAKGADFGWFYLKQLWHHYRGVYVEKIQSANTKMEQERWRKKVKA